jgi:hypothetical protein
MVEVAIESLKAVLPAEEILPGSGEYRIEEPAAAETEVQAAAVITE